ncbi:PR domain zinc finger protein 12-like [Lytechinus variegatus]|uniref:PR domain zinc finger protein 12-like n=1 Tax=Lytechinus variegatus TaxID=7654 RepID=UPI001BB21799|nr:PR domain zinc finger protein 12-like [Lytechinus variegatus]
MDRRIASPDYISQEMLRNALYGKWCDLSGRSLPADNNTKARQLLEKKKGLPMPPQVTLCPSSLPGVILGVFSTDWIKEGTEMGPYSGRIVRPQDIPTDRDNRFMWEVFDDEGRLVHFVDASEEATQTWMSHVNCARNDQEQNLEVFQMGSEIYYRAIKTIPPDQELLVYYGSSFDLFLGIPCGPVIQEQRTKISTEDTVSDLQTTPTPQSRLHCVVCRRGFNSRSNLRSHMRIHTLEKPFMCKFCHRRFSQSSTLRNHTRLHTGEKPYRCNVCHSAYSQLAGLRAHQKSARHRPPNSSSTITTMPMAIQRPPLQPVPHTVPAYKPTEPGKV